MKVLINNKTYQMGRTQFKGLLEIAKENVKHGIIAIEKDNIVEMRKDTFKSNTQFKNKVKEFKSLGYKVYKNG